MATVTIKNLDRLQKKLNKLSDVDITNIVKKATVFVQGQAKTLAPVDTGQLRSSIHTEVKKDGKTVIGRVYTNNDHAVYVEFGTGQRGASSQIDRPINVTYKQDWAGMIAQPYLYPALKGSKKYIDYLINQGLKDKIRQIGGGQ